MSSRSLDEMSPVCGLCQWPTRGGLSHFTRSKDLFSATQTWPSPAMRELMRIKEDACLRAVLAVAAGQFTDPHMTAYEQQCTKQAAREVIVTYPEPTAVDWLAMYNEPSWNGRLAFCVGFAPRGNIPGLTIIPPMTIEIKMEAFDNEA